MLSNRTQPPDPRDTTGGPANKSDEAKTWQAARSQYPENATPPQGVK
jgi:hypothetical protein